MVDGAVQPGTVVTVTGPGGFVGRRVCARLATADYKVRPAGRRHIGEIHRGTDWHEVLAGTDAVVHLAARVHQMGPETTDSVAAFQEVNLHGTATLVRQAVDAGCRRFVFMSTIKVIGERGDAIGPDAPPAPHDAYAVSKTEAESAVRDLAGTMEVVILRPPLVYGPGVRANFERLMRLAASGWPLPFGGIANLRSVIHVDNLADAVRHALTCRPGTYHPKDPYDVSTPDLLRLLAQGMDRPSRLFSVPDGILQAMGAVTGKSAEVARLTGSFTSDGAMDGWIPPISTEDALRTTARAFLDSRA